MEEKQELATGAPRYGEVETLKGIVDAIVLR